MTAPKVVKPTKSAANSCVKLSAGNASSLDIHRGVVDTNVTVRNTCSETITVFVQLNACKSPKAYLSNMIGKSRKKINLRSGDSLSMRVSHRQGLRGATTLARASAVYAGQKGAYPKYGC